MRKAEVTLKDGFRYYRLDNHYHDVKLGDEIDLSDMTPRDAEARIQAGHVKLLATKTGKATADADAKDKAAATANADKAAAAADADTKGKK